MDQNLKTKYNKLTEILREGGRICVAYSGGVDSTLLLFTAAETLGAKNVLAVTAASETYTEAELRSARDTVSGIGVKHLTLKTSELSETDFTDNTPDRCYFCKKSFFSQAVPIAHTYGFAVICDGSNTDDLKDYRPGRRAVSELGIRSPLIEADLNKDQVRELSKELGISGYDRPANPCLASRIPYGSAITIEKLKAVAAAEEYLRSQGFREFRVRHHGDVARIELSIDDEERFHDRKARAAAAAALKDFGFTWVCLDLEGYRMGSMNEILQPEPG